MPGPALGTGFQLIKPRREDGPGCASENTNGGKHLGPPAAGDGSSSSSTSTGSWRRTPAVQGGAAQRLPRRRPAARPWLASLRSPARARVQNQGQRPLPLPLPGASDSQRLPRPCSAFLRTRNGQVRPGPPGGGSLKSASVVNTLRNPQARSPSTPAPASADPASLSASRSPSPPPPAWGSRRNWSFPPVDPSSIFSKPEWKSKLGRSKLSSSMEGKKNQTSPGGGARGGAAALCTRQGAVEEDAPWPASPRAVSLHHHG